LKANVSAEYISVEGKVVGDLAGSASVVVNDGANVKGNINCPKVTLRDMTGKTKSQAESPEKAAKASESRQKKASGNDDKAEPVAKKSASA